MLILQHFEATCDSPITPEPQEIIEFPVLKVSATNFKTESVFHRYIQPRVHKELTSFCTQLTGIIQDMVNNQPHLDSVLSEFDKWMQHEGLLSSDCKFIFVTCGDWDLKTMLPKQCDHFNLQKPVYFDSWINIKKSYAEVTGTWPKDLSTICLSLGLPMLGRLHSGIDDCRNIAAVLGTLNQKGYLYHPFPSGKPEVELSRYVRKKIKPDKDSTVT